MTVAVHPATNANPFYMLGRFDIHEGMHGGWVVWDTRDVSGPDAHFRTRPMALRWAAEQAGIQRQRVEAEVHTVEDLDYAGRLLSSYDVLTYATRAGDEFHRWFDDLPSALAAAHEIAEERYAALGVTT